MPGAEHRRLALRARRDKIEDVPSSNEGVPGARIGNEHPFLPAEDERSPIRRLRGRLASPVTLWTADNDRRPAGLPVASTQVIEGEPAYVMGAIDEETDLWDAVRTSGRFAVAVLRWEHREVADVFGGLMPLPGGPFRSERWADDWVRTDWGPVLSSVTTWAGCRFLGYRELGWSILVEAEIEHVVVGDEVDPLLYRRGRYLTVVE